MSETLILVFVIITALVAGFLIAVLIEMRRAARELTKFLETARPTMEKLREAADETTSVARDMKSFSSALGDTAHAVRAVNSLIGAVPPKVSALKAGITAGLVALFKNVFKRGDEEENR